ncbi:hypothetical protein [Streptomyces sp. NPDC057381]|uniref:hypothetical protein n=1 Tax=Streptomyces sp. NPDC057381 TaxID=3346111 RepID=UPI00363284F5
MARVTMAHPDLPDRRIEVDEVSVPHHQAAGWQVVTALPDTTRKAARGRQQKKGE